MMSIETMRTGRKMALGLGLVWLLVLLTAALAWHAVSAIGGQWREYEATIGTRQTIVAQAGEALGDGVHWFKNAILRGGDYPERFGREMDRLERLSAQYRDTRGVSPEEFALLDRMDAGVRSYRAAIAALAPLRQARKDPTELDRAVQGADAPLREALAGLRRANADASARHAAAVHERVRGAENRLLAAALATLALVVGLGYLLTRSTIAPIAEAVRIAQTVASGDLASPIEAQGDGEAAQLLQALKSMQDELAEIVSSARDAAAAVASASGEIMKGNTDLSQRTEMQASALEETASSMEELTATVRQNADAARQEQQIVEKAHASAVRAAEVISRTVGSMDEISRSSREIGGILSVVDSMAFQTNLLALNAAVEAARAGEHGRGFAVVAAEVRTLAGRSAQAAREIKALIGQSAHAAQEGEKSVEECGEALSEVLGAVKQVQTLAGEIAVASREQASGIEQVNKAIVHMDEMTQRNAALVEESAAAAESLEEMAQTLTRTVSVFKLDRAGTGAPAPGVRPDRFLPGPRDAGAAPRKSLRDGSGRP